jgi:hypothetical protein
MLRLLFLSSTSLALVACGDDTCGPGDAPDNGLFASNADVTITFTGLHSGQNNDCPDPDAPPGVVSLTIQGVQQGGPGLLTLCIARPDKLDSGTIPLGTSGARIIDLKGTVDDCMYAFDSSRPVTGTVMTFGLCDNGANSAGYAIGVDGNVSMTRMCPTMNDTLAVAFNGKAAVSAD